MLLTILFYVFMFISVINMIHLGLFLIGANIYDFKSFKANRAKNLRVRHRPTVSVLIPAHNEEKSIIRCIESVRRSTVRDLDIIVIDDDSSDDTYRLVKNFIRRTHDFNAKVRLMKTPTNVGKAGALNYALNSGLKSEFVMTLDADSILHERAIENATDYMLDDPTVAGVAANVRVSGSQSLIGLVQRFEYMVGYRSKKFYTISNSEFIVGGVASTYRLSLLKQVGFYDTSFQTEDIALSLKIAALGNRAHKLVYGADVLAMTQGVQSFKALLKQRYRWKLGSMQSLIRNRQLFLNTDKKYSRTLTWYRIPMAFLGELIVLVEPILLMYVIYLSFLVLSPQAFVGAYAVISLYLLWNVWPDEHMKFVEKLKLTAYIPAMYFLFYIMNIVQLYAVVKCIFNYQKVLGLKATSAIWTSPERVSEPLAAAI